ncbi:MAG: two-component sensor histidine kinase, partial [Rhodobiaceae bacterium]|nr:two-component sensor histidine kinase [Rhodobiaceae bacterium]
MSKTTVNTDELNLLAAIPQPFLAINREGHLVYLNFAAEEFFAAGRNIMMG